MLVSAIMPTKDRAAFIPGVIACFLSQDWPDKELLILDDGESIAHLIPKHHPEISYHRCEPRSVGAKRNIACSRAQGEVIVHWDSDDWFAPNRITDQVLRHTESKASISGYSKLPFADDDLRRAWMYSSWVGQYVVGTSLCYSKEYWLSHPFLDVSQGEDNHMVHNAPSVVTADGSRFIVARTHGGNTVERRHMLSRTVWDGGIGQVWKEINYEHLASIGYPVLTDAIIQA